MELVFRIINIITPVLIISAFGYGYAKLRQPDMTQVNRLSTDLLYPLLIYTAMASKDFHILDYLPLIGGGLAVLLGSGLIGWWFARMLNYNRHAFIPSMMFTNVANMGLPLTLFAFGPEMLPAAVSLFMTFSLAHFTFGIRLCAPHASMKGILRPHALGHGGRSRLQPAGHNIAGLARLQHQDAWRRRNSAGLVHRRSRVCNVPRRALEHWSRWRHPVPTLGTDHRLAAHSSITVEHADARGALVIRRASSGRHELHFCRPLPAGPRPSIGNRRSWEYCLDLLCATRALPRHLICVADRREAREKQKAQPITAGLS